MANNGNPDPTAVVEALRAERSKYPAIISSDQMVDVLNSTALKFPGMGLHRYDGTSGIQVRTGIRVSRQVLRYLPPGDDYGFWSDVLVSTGTGAAVPAAPVWKRSTDDSTTFVLPIGVMVIDPPVPPQPPPVNPPPSNLDLILLNRIIALEKEIKELRLIPREYSIQTVNGNYITAEGGGGGGVNATRTTADAWEWFKLVPR